MKSRRNKSSTLEIALRHKLDVIHVATQSSNCGLPQAVVLGFALATSLNCAAAEPRFYLGFRGGNTFFSHSSSTSSTYSEDPVANNTGFGFYGGLNLVSGLAIELEYNKFDSHTEKIFVCEGLYPNQTCRNQTYDVSIDTYSAYATYRTAGDIYFKARAGYAYEDIHSNSIFELSHNKSNEGFSFSLGTGINLGAADFELQETYFESDIRYTSLGMHFKF